VKWIGKKNGRMNLRHTAVWTYGQSTEGYQSLITISCRIKIKAVFTVATLPMRPGYVESLLLTNCNKTKFHAASMRSAAVRSSDGRTVGWTADDDRDVAVQRRSIVYTDGQPGTLRCAAVALSSPVRVEVYVGRRNVTAQLRPVQAVTTEGRPGMRRLRYSAELVRHDFRPSVDDSGRRMTCTAYFKDEDKAANATSARLVVRRESYTVNPLIATLKPHSNGPSYSNTVIGTLAVDGWTVAFGTARRGLAGAAARSGHSSLYQM